MAETSGRPRLADSHAALFSSQRPSSLLRAVSWWQPPCDRQPATFSTVQLYAPLVSGREFVPLDEPPRAVFALRLSSCLPWTMPFAPQSELLQTFLLLENCLNHRRTPAWARPSAGESA
jgi:hypothetical protein